MNIAKLSKLKSKRRLENYPQKKKKKWGNIHIDNFPESSKKKNHLRSFSRDKFLFA